ncbi:hypothetical protein [Sphingobacterium suaedae]|uniref:Uncharacterized protein n=1 Tax=Sphingobacterium suaedae TaxID=1686402 RepID=A0ABW5KMH9_9SPHI
MFCKVWITGLCVWAVSTSIAATPARIVAYTMPPMLQDTTGRSDTRQQQKSPEKTNGAEPVKETAGQTVEKVIKVVPKARNQQIPRPVIPRINHVAPGVKVKVKTNVKTKINIKL